LGKRGKRSSPRVPTASGGKNTWPEREGTEEIEGVHLLFPRSCAAVRLTFPQPFVVSIFCMTAPLVLDDGDGFNSRRRGLLRTSREWHGSARAKGRKSEGKPRPPRDAGPAEDRAEQHRLALLHFVLLRSHPSLIHQAPENFLVSGE